VEKETTYTVTWTLGNSWNDVRDVVATATLPPYVKWENVISPTDQNITYNPSGGTITWNVGDMKAGEKGRKVSFQVSFIPSIGQEGGTAIIVNPPRVKAVDRFTNSSMNRGASRKQIPIS